MDLDFFRECSHGMSPSVPLCVVEDIDPKQKLQQIQPPLLLLLLLLAAVAWQPAWRTLVVPHVSSLTRLSQFGDGNFFGRTRSRSSSNNDPLLVIPSTEELHANLKDWEERMNKATDIDQFESVQKEFIAWAHEFTVRHLHVLRHVSTFLKQGSRMHVQGFLLPVFLH
jgi:hypothetical protein